MKFNMYVYSYNIETGEAEASVEECDDHEDDFSSQNPFLLEDEDFETATYGDFHGDSVYCESLVSAERAKLLVLQKCDELATKFIMARQRIAPRIL